MEEIWKPIMSYSGLYEVSNLGNVRSVDRISESYGGRIWNRKGKQLKPYINKKGYAIVDLCVNGKYKSHSVHRLVSETFIENPLKKYAIDHIDRNPSNNRVDNLRWATGCENQANRGIPKHNTSGELHIKCVYKFQVTRAGKMIQKTFNTMEEALAFRKEQLGY